MEIKIEVRDVAAAIRDVEQQYRGFLERVADEIVAEAPNFTPKRTGRASEGWAKRMGRDGFEVENKVPYVGYLEKPYVKSKKAPNGIIGPTLTSVKGKLR